MMTTLSLNYMLTLDEIRSHDTLVSIGSFLTEFSFNCKIDRFLNDSPLKIQGSFLKWITVEQMQRQMNFPQELHFKSNPHIIRKNTIINSHNYYYDVVLPKHCLLLINVNLPKKNKNHLRNVLHYKAVVFEYCLFCFVIWEFIKQGERFGICFSLAV